MRLIFLEVKKFVKSLNNFAKLRFITFRIIYLVYYIFLTQSVKWMDVQNIRDCRKLPKARFGESIFRNLSESKIQLEYRSNEFFLKCSFGYAKTWKFLQKVSKNSNDYKWGDQKEENDHGILWFCKIIHNRPTKKCLPLHRRKNYSLEVELKLHFTRGKRTFHEKCSANWQSSGFLALSDEMSKSSCHVEHEIKKCDCVR